MTTTVKVSVNGEGYVALVDQESSTHGMTEEGCAYNHHNFSQQLIRQSDGEVTLGVSEGCSIRVIEMTETEWQKRREGRLGMDLAAGAQSVEN